VLVYASMKRRGNTMNIDYSIILTRKEIESITEEKYNFIKNEVKRIADEAERIIQANKPSWVIERGHYKILHKENYARETVFLKDYKDENFNIKTLMTSKIIYSNTEMVINILLSKNIIKKLFPLKFFSYNSASFTTNSIALLFVIFPPFIVSYKKEDYKYLSIY